MNIQSVNAHQHNEPQTKNPRRDDTKSPMDWVGLFICCALALIFEGARGAKLVGSESIITLFQQIGYGEWFWYFTGFVEIISALILLFAVTRKLAASLHTCTVIGAIFTHVFLVGGSTLPEFILCLLAIFVLWWSKQ
ncbi:MULTISPECIES: DoxX family protein [unclassified Pseudoalteromonas]|uniref:DoxX family protein n=1 Tax=unclassified Pseudoalteromonas TaxID=194690 RepID=UPI000BBE3185|nr:DoxX family protein [Pseudoalteromonas sp. 1_2015MBL_MicDiv]ATG79717.1 hypothetical protein AOR04_19440 [Pseudoalteromonas sp. 1_2015MBL_MicDiv]